METPFFVLRLGVQYILLPDEGEPGGLVAEPQDATIFWTPKAVLLAFYRAIIQDPDRAETLRVEQIKPRAVSLTYDDREEV